jgi:osmotically-inducible protein OsmY
LIVAQENLSDPTLVARIEAQLAETGLPVAVEASDGALILNGVVESEEARQAAADIVAQVAPRAVIDNQIELETILPTDIDDFAGAEASAELADTSAEVADELEPDFAGRPVVTDPLSVAGGGSGGLEDEAESGETYTPPDDPVLTTDQHGQPRVLGGFDSSSDDDEVDLSSDGRRGDEAIADAVRRELAEDSTTTELVIAVVVRNGVVHLHGRVADLDDADNAESVAARVPGVREVVEALNVEGV